MPFPFPTLKKGTTPQSVELNQSELQVLKDLARSFLNVDLSQLEALLHARAPLPDINADSVLPSILTPLDPSSASKLEAQAARPASQPRTSEPRATPQRPSKSPTPTRSMGTTGDSSSGKTGTDQTDFRRPSNVSNNRGPIRFVSQSFNNSTIAGSKINNHSGGTNYHAVSSQDFNNSSIDGSTINNHSNNNNIHRSNVMYGSQPWRTI